MIGITLSSEQIRNAPVDVRRWIEREVMTSMNQHATVENGSGPHGEHLAACSEQDVAAILSQIQSVLPAVNVLFEFGRQGAVFGQPNIEAFRLLDVASHARLQNVSQVIACLDMINQALGRMCDDTDAKFCAFDREGHCFITQETQQNILRVWQKVIASQQLDLEQTELPPASDSSGAAGNNQVVQDGPSRPPATEGIEAPA
ncbi:hypothetical protein HU230_0024230 [Bradyrhizobium quebecense]|uniref:hypothetical protein n=1 Tax=Bradyrhizobium quebecense TaxID=2748629 RepID=UPI001CD643BA|nr:hypothetical protein [Bradyrhizobium quebecense]UGA41487.1 hypothetical protein HU230_0024230 [Bradyrhizobium quebecense]